MKMKIYKQLGVAAILMAALSYQKWGNPGTPASLKMAVISQKQIRDEVAYRSALKEADIFLSSCGSDIPEFVAKAGLDNGIPVRVIAADIIVESGCNTHAVSKAGAVGLLQVNPKIWKTNKNLFNPEINIQIGTKILAQQIHRHGVRNGLRYYFGVTYGSDASDAYADRVLTIAYRR